MKKVLFIVVFGIILIVFGVKYSQFKQIKSEKMMNVYSAIDSIIPIYYHQYWTTPTNLDLANFVDKYEKGIYKNEIIHCFENKDFELVEDSSENYLLLKLFNKNNSIYGENSLLLNEMNFIDFLLKNEIIIIQKYNINICSYFQYKFFKKNEPVENENLKKEMQKILYQLLVKEKELDLGNLDRCMFNVKIKKSNDFELNLVCGNVDNEFPLTELRSLVREIISDERIKTSVDEFYFPLYY